MPWLFLVAYTCSGIAGLIYEVSWTRLLTLHIGHTTAAAAAVVAAFLGGLAAGAAYGGQVAARLTRVSALRTYVVLELVVAIAALLLPLEVQALRPLLSWAYGNGDPSPWFTAVRLGSCVVMVFAPAAALGATFPMAIRWFASESGGAARLSGWLYALNTAGAALGAMLAGFVLIPAIGISGATGVGIAASAVAAAAVSLVIRTDPGLRDSGSDQRTGFPSTPVRAIATAPVAAERARDDRDARWLAAGVLGLSGFASLVHEIAWTRILVLVLGPTTYAFAATLAAVIGGVAIGSAAGSWMVGRTRRPEAWLATALAAAAMTTSYTYSLAGQQIPSLVARQMANADEPFQVMLRQGLMLTAGLILPTAICLGAAFPLALALAAGPAEGVTRRFGVVYAINTIGAVSGSLTAGYVFIPAFGLQATLQIVSGSLIAAALIVVWKAALTGAARAAGFAAAIAAVLLVAISPEWDRELLASGLYMYAPFVPKDLDLTTQLKAGTMLYYREGASATVSVKKLTGTTTLAVDGKVDASNRGDMLTQKLVAHLPLLVHDQPREIAIIGLGSGVTAGSALRHPIARADVIEISPEVIEASRFFTRENHDALADPRTRLIVGDGRSHLLLASKKYDVVISEPSNPWIAGVAALFTREYFEGVRARLAPGGIVCQWANAYNISDPDLRSIVATFIAVFPHGTVWLVGGDDVLMMASDGPLDERVARVRENWTRPGVADDLALVSVLEPFSLWSLYAGGPAELQRYAAGASVLTDDIMRLEFSAPRELHNRRAGENGATLLGLLSGQGPAVIREALRMSTATQWRNRAAMMSKSDVHARAYDDYLRALQMDLVDVPALDGFVRTAVLTSRSGEALTTLRALIQQPNAPAQTDLPADAGKTATHSPAHAVGTARILVAVSRLQAASGAGDDAVVTAREAARLQPDDPAPLQQLAALYADTSNTVRLDETVARLQAVSPNEAPAFYFAAVAAFLHGNPAEAVAQAERAIAADANYAPTYDLIGAAYTRLERADLARQAFERSLTFDAHDSAAYTNLGLLALAEGNRAAARGYFAEALWLTPDSATARQGLARTTR